MSDDLSSDQASSIRAVIAQERASVAFYAAKLRDKAPSAFKRRWRALKARHQAYIKRWQEELKHEQANPRAARPRLP